MKNIGKNLLLIFLGVIISVITNVTAEAVISSGSVSYSNTTVNAALDELFSAVDLINDLQVWDEIVTVKTAENAYVLPFTRIGGYELTTDDIPIRIQAMNSNGSPAPAFYNKSMHTIFVVSNSESVNLYLYYAS